jgi:hypothetical protein
MSPLLEDVLLMYLDRQGKQQDPSEITQLVDKIEDQLRLDQMSFPERDGISTALSDLVAAGRRSGFVLGIRFSLDVMKEIR